jgi:hypothetical protein
MDLKRLRTFVTVAEHMRSVMSKFESGRDKNSKRLRRFTK